MKNLEFQSDNLILIAACCAINARYKISEQLLNVDEVVAGRLKIRVIKPTQPIIHAALAPEPGNWGNHQHRINESKGLSHFVGYHEGEGVGTAQCTVPRNSL